MTTYYAPWMIDDRGHICDVCEIKDGRPTLYWEKKDFDLCQECLVNVFQEYSDYELHGQIEIVRMKIPESLRNAVFERDENKCVRCGTVLNLTVDHIKPFSKGGKTEEENLQTLCMSCNRKKSAK